MTVKHATASTFVFGRLLGGWQIGLIVHPLFGRLMLPGGHVEPGESPPQAASREVAEESGLDVELVPALAPPVPEGLSSARVLVEQPWWILEQPIPADNHLAEAHVHIDHLYVGVARSVHPVSSPAHPFSWHSAAELPGLHMFPDTRLFAAALLADAERALGAGTGERSPR